MEQTSILCSNPLFHAQHPIPASKRCREASSCRRASFKVDPHRSSPLLHSSSYVKDMLKERAAAWANVLLFGQARASVRRVVAADESGQQRASSKNQVDNSILHTAHCGCEKSQHTVVGAAARLRWRPAREPGERPGRYRHCKRFGSNSSGRVWSAVTERICLGRLCCRCLEAKAFRKA